MSGESTQTANHIYRAGTASFDIYDPPQALGNLLRLAAELLKSERAALYELEEIGRQLRPTICARAPAERVGTAGRDR